MIAALALTLFAAQAAGADPLIDVAEAIPGVRVDLRYATPDNFMKEQVYPDGARCLLRRSVVERLARVQARLREQGYGLLLWDCYRPRSVQWKMWRILPKPGLVADPRKGSNHNRGTAVDLTLVRADGTPVEMPTGFDDFSPQGRRDATRGVSAEARANRRLLQEAMTGAGFTTIRLEWWHYNAPGARRYAVEDVSLLAPTDAAPDAPKAADAAQDDVASDAAARPTRQAPAGPDGGSQKAPSGERTE